MRTNIFWQLNQASRVNLPSLASAWPCWSDQTQQEHRNIRLFYTYLCRMVCL